jgi:hypothetical protein
MTSMNMIPTTGYTAWFCGAEDYDIFALPIVGLAPHWVSYEGDEAVLEYEPCVLDRNGSPQELHELFGQMSGFWVGGHLIGITPAHMDWATAADYLGRFRVALDPHAPGQIDDEEMGTLIERAQRQARGQYTWGKVWEPA